MQLLLTLSFTHHRRRNSSISQCRILWIQRKSSRDSRTPGVRQILGVNQSWNLYVMTILTLNDPHDV